MSSFKQMIKDGEIKRADAMKVRLQDIHEEPGFNLRQEGEDLEASIDALAAHLVAGGMVPPLEVRPREEGGVYVVDGHRRRRAYLKAFDTIKDASGECWLSVVAFTGNDADRVARIITSAEGRSLSLLEIAEGYKRLAAFDWSADDIARKVGKTRQHVEQALLLANANSDVRALVKQGGVSATTAIDAVRKHGDKAGAVLGDAVGKAKAAGKTKATAGAITGKALPKAIVTELVDGTDRLIAGLSKEARTAVETLNLSPGDVSPMVEVSARDLLELIAIAEAVKETKAKQEQRGREEAAKGAQTDLAGDK